METGSDHWSAADTTGKPHIPLETSRDQQRLLEIRGKTRDKQRPLETNRDQCTPSWITRDQQRQLKTTGDLKKLLENRRHYCTAPEIIGL